MWFKCIGGPLNGRDFLPGDDVKEFAPVSLASHQEGYYLRIGRDLIWSIL